MKLVGRWELIICGVENWSEYQRLLKGCIEEVMKDKQLGEKSKIYQMDENMGEKDEAQDDDKTEESIRDLNTGKNQRSSSSSKGKRLMR